MALSYRDLLEKVTILTRMAIQNQVRSDVYCHNLVEYINAYGKVGFASFASRVPTQAAVAQEEQSVFAGNRVEDFSKLGQRAREADMTPEQERRLEEADDDGRSLLDDGDAFTE